MLKIKVCGLNDPSNVAEVAGTLPDFMGFIFFGQSKRYVGNDPPASLFDRIPPGILKVGVFVNEKPSVIQHLMRSFDLDLVQLHGDETPVYCNSLKQEGLKIIKAHGLDPGFCFDKLIEYNDVCDYFLFDTKTSLRGGSSLKFDWERLVEYHFTKPFFLSGGIGPGDVADIKKVRNKNLFAVDINSSFEISPGIKNIEKVKNFIYDLKH